MLPREAFFWLCNEKQQSGPVYSLDMELQPVTLQGEDLEDVIVALRDYRYYLLEFENSDRKPDDLLPNPEPELCLGEKLEAVERLNVLLKLLGAEGT